jgi:uncharacterized coiled-coil DUF342 family protein
MTWLLILALALDLTAVKSEPNLEKRSDLALKNANQALTSARDAYRQGDLAKTQSALEEVRDSVDLSYQSLLDTGKDPRKHSKHFKRAEMETREMLRQLDSLRESMSFADRATLDAVRRRIADVHDKLLEGIMSKKEKK